jgi:DNA repair protein SbcC/Rad50
MIPLKLQIKNFLSYGPDIQTIDFTPYQLICLSGKNGHGKSALLDAITWALWGQARKSSGTAKADQGLLRLGETHMMVLFDFEFNNQTYRIRREYTHSYGKPYTVLEFGILDTVTNSIIPLTDKTIRDTQGTIDTTIHIDFESFVNSAFLRQGQSHEFSKKSPKERKEVLATILGLHQYEMIRRLAQDKIRFAQQEKITLSSIQNKLSQELLQKTTVMQKLTQLQQDLLQIAQEEKLISEEQAVHANSRKNLVIAQQQHVMLQSHLQQKQESYTKQKTILKTCITTWRTVHKTQITLPDITVAEAEKKRVSNLLTQHQQQFERALQIKEQLLKSKEEEQTLSHQHQQEITRIIQQKQLEIERLSTEKQILEKRETEITTVLNQHILELKQTTERITILITQTEKHDTLHKQLEAVENQFIKRKSYYQKFIAHGNWLTNELHSLEQKKNLSQDDENPSCSLCEQNLSAARRRFLKEKFGKQEQFLKHQITRLTSVVEKLKKILIEQHKQYNQAKQTYEKSSHEQATLTHHYQTQQKLDILIQDHTNHLEQVKKQISTQQIVVEEAQKLSENIQKIGHHKLHQDPTYQAIVNHIRELELDAQKLAYDPAEHKNIQLKLMQLEQQLHSHEHLHEEQHKQEQRKHEIQTLCGLLKQYKHEIHSLQDNLKAYNQLATKAAFLQEQEDKLQLTNKKLTQQKEILLEHKGNLEAQQIKLIATEQEHLQNQSTEVTLQNKIDDYQAIATATSKDGIQALLIEEVIPEIEQEANRLLSQLTNNQAHISIESLRDLKKGGTKETLDIKISDAAGIRPYELFSGGEAFRIDFALRIAISKLLVRRAGTALQTLIIDEGFGSQDEEGLSHIMDAIHMIQTDFAKIIIVSHLPTMKDQFPVHFVVEKQAQGSKISVIEQG